MHDSAEAYLPDIPKPTKRGMPDFELIEHDVLRCIFSRYNMPLWPLPKEVKLADLILLKTETRDLMGPPPESWVDFETVRALPEKIRPLAPPQAKALFLSHFYQWSMYAGK
jgi:5'-deoxynucleotidase YfbR-like HD superfamily hydrolase